MSVTRAQVLGEDALSKVPAPKDGTKHQDMPRYEHHQEISAVFKSLARGQSIG